MSDDEGGGKDGGMNTFSLMEDINDKLKILNYETKFCRYSTLYIDPTSTGFSCPSLSLLIGPRNCDH